MTELTGPLAHTEWTLAELERVTSYELAGRTLALLAGDAIPARLAC